MSTSAQPERAGAPMPARRRQDAELFRLLVDRVVDYAIFLLTPDGHVASWNAGAERLKGYRADEIIGQSFERFYTDEERAAGRPARLLAAARAEGHIQDEGWRVRKDGSRFWANVVITALYDDAGELRGFAKVTRDLTERWQNEQERARRVAAEGAAERIERLQIATAALAAASQSERAAEVLAEVCASDLGAAATAVALVMPGGEALEVAYACGFEPRKLQAGDVLGRHDPYPLTYAWRTGRPLFIRSREEVQTNDPELTALLEWSPHAAWAALPLMVGRRVLGVLSVGFEQARGLDADERGFLLALAEAGSQAIDRARLYESEQRARAEAEAAVHARDEFLSIASHELRTPLAAVKATAQLAQRAIQRGQVDPARMTRHLQSISRAADRLGSLVEDLLDVSRLRTGRLRLRRETLNLGTLVEEIVGRYRATATAHEFTLELPEGGVLVSADPLRLEQVLDNLLSNAVKYSPASGEVRVRLSPEETGVALTVTDHGIGLPAGQEARIFEAFGRASNAAAQQIPGLGLGLAICRQLVEAHGGRIWASSPGEQLGTTFGVWLPAADASAADGEDKPGDG